MSISSVTGAARVLQSTADGTAGNISYLRTTGDTGTDTSASSADSTSTSADAAFKTPTPPRFPWLSRLSDELAATATKKPAFQSAPVLGDNVDQSA